MLSRLPSKFAFVLLYTANLLLTVSKSLPQRPKRRISFLLIGIVLYFWSAFEVGWNYGESTLAISRLFLVSCLTDLIPYFPWKHWLTGVKLRLDVQCNPSQPCRLQNALSMFAASHFVHDSKHAVNIRILLELCALYQHQKIRSWL